LIGTTTREHGVTWDILDFAVFATMLAGVSVIYGLTKRTSDDIAYRSAVGVALAAAFILIWVNGAVGIIGDAGNDANLMFFGVLGVGVLGAIVARFQPRGMARALYATAVAQCLVAVIAVTADLGSTGPIWPRDILALTVFLTALWLLSARLFGNAARNRHAPSAARQN
jgi:hypothetical protein